MSLERRGWCDLDVIIVDPFRFKWRGEGYDHSTTTTRAVVTVIGEDKDEVLDLLRVAVYDVDSDGAVVPVPRSSS